MRILHCDLIKLPVINTEPEPPILLFYKKKQMEAGEVEYVIIPWLSSFPWLLFLQAIADTHEREAEWSLG